LAWETFSDRELAERVCTKEQLDALRLWADGYGRRQGSARLGITVDTWRYRLARALDAIDRARVGTEDYAVHYADRGSDAAA
jgi:DNA-binding CsgD family transcriptional regulator